MWVEGKQVVDMLARDMSLAHRYGEGIAMHIPGIQQEPL